MSGRRQERPEPTLHAAQLSIATFLADAPAEERETRARILHARDLAHARATGTFPRGFHVRKVYTLVAKIARDTCFRRLPLSVLDDVSAILTEIFRVAEAMERIEAGRG